MRTKTNKNWTHEDAGWYTHPQLGGVCWEEARPMPLPQGRILCGWYWWPKDGSNPLGPFGSATAAMAKAEEFDECQRAWRAGKLDEV
jgi:hypothetical protein